MRNFSVLKTTLALDTDDDEPWLNFLPCRFQMPSANPFDEIVWPPESSCKDRTGYSSEQLLSMFETYRLELFDQHTPLTGNRTATEEHKRFYLVFVYIHMHPKVKDCIAVLRINGESKGNNRYYYDRYCRPIAWKLGEIMHEIHPEDRFDEYNHSPLVSERVTHILDSLPIRLCNSSMSLLQNLNVNPKYGGAVLKVTIGITCTCIPVCFSINLGIPHDGGIAVKEEGYSWFERESWEWAMGDGPYESMERVAVKFRPRPIPGAAPLQYAPIPDDEMGDNGVFDFIRGRIEHLNAQFVAHEIFNGRKYRGSYQDLVAYVKITIHALTLQIREFETSRQREGFGPYPHHMPPF